MANHVLFWSSLVGGAISLYFVLNYATSRLFSIIVICGVLTSLVNHALTHNVAKLVDRLVMLIGAFYDFSVHFSLAYPMNCFLSFLLATSIVLFFTAKYRIQTTRDSRCGNAYHVQAHLVLAMCHSVMAFYT
jgi:hypothetical protein